MKTTQRVRPIQYLGGYWDHTDLEHAAFDRGVRDGEMGYDADECPYLWPELKEAWHAGRSVGALNQEAREHAKRD